MQSSDHPKPNPAADGGSVWLTGCQFGQVSLAANVRFGSKADIPDACLLSLGEGFLPAVPDLVTSLFAATFGLGQRAPAFAIQELAIPGIDPSPHMTKFRLETGAGAVGQPNIPSVAPPLGKPLDGQRLTGIQHRLELRTGR